MRSEADVSSELISACICTFRRPAGLMSALFSLANQKLPSNLKLEIIVVDNDSQPSARELCHQFLVKFPTADLKYFNETTSGVSFARNRCLQEASGLWIAFLDDDEEACVDWVTLLWSTARTQKADAVFGPVLPIYDSPVPSWINVNRINDRVRYSTGKIICWKDARSGNVLLNRKLIQLVGEFDVRMARTGGEDSFFFATAERAGAKLVWCDEAEIYELVADQRMTLKWVIQRSFHGGRTFVRINVALKGAHVYVWWAFHGLLTIVLFAPLALFLWVIGKRAWINCLRKIAGGAGKIVAPFYSRGLYAQ